MKDNHNSFNDLSSGNVLADFLVGESSCRFGISRADITRGATAGREITSLRQALYYVLRKYEDWTLQKIGAYFNKKHNTVLYGIKKTEDLLSVNDIPTKIKVNFLEKAARKVN